ncbi:MAG: phosphate ABC transporter substrate-binding protein, PhoT family [Sphingobacteriales bacterium]|nr:MAG: phosphate ABC transporter substrate-binding protein, PhoT family [Sphingobacteriales bacterium]
MSAIKHILIFLSATILLSACAGEKKDGPADTLGSGTIDISVDETFRPIIEEQLKVFDSSFPEAHIKATYKAESECMKDFLDGKAHLVLVTRGLLPNEKQFLEQKKVVPNSLPLAKDGIAVIVNNSVIDTMTLSEVKGILTGKFIEKKTVVFDNQGSSTLRYMLDSLIPGEKLASNVFAAKTTDSVIKYVANNPDAVGFIGASHVSDFSDPEGLAFIKEVKVVAVMNEKDQQFYKPYQAYIAQQLYPLTRDLYYINSETYPGLGTGFANFLGKERGQLIFKQARLFPLRSNVILREASVNP